MTEIDGVPVLFAPSPGPTRAGLVFRVGRADETLATAGITHLVEHLALHRHGTADYHYNGSTSATTTEFISQGTPESVVTFLADVCAGLRDLPLDRIPTELRIIETEQDGATMPADQQHPLWRHGARDFGLVSYPQWGVRTLTAARVTAWAAERFTRENAVLWIAGERIPEGLRLDLPSGRRWPLPTASSALPVVPAYFSAGRQLIVLDAPVPRTAPSTVYARALERALFRELRQAKGLSYTAATAYRTDGRPEATLVAVADAQPEQVDAALAGFLTELDRLADADLDQDELNTIRTLEVEGLSDPEVEARLLPRRATDLLTGFPSRSTPELVAGFEHVTAAEVRDVARSVRDTALLMIPETVRTPPVGFEAAPNASRFRVIGTRYRSRAQHDVALIVAEDGVSLDTPHCPVTVLFADCSAMLRWPDGARRLIGADGIGATIEPGVYGLPADVLARIDAAVPASAIVDMPTRDPADIPRVSRLRSLRRRLRGGLLPWRARLHRFSVFRGGLAGMLKLAAMAVMAVVFLALAVAEHNGIYAFIAVFWTAGLLIRALR
ncbi:insulinase family protein [Longispora urticae]